VFVLFWRKKFLLKVQTKLSPMSVWPSHKSNQPSSLIDVFVSTSGLLHALEKAFYHPAGMAGSYPLWMKD